MNDIEQLQAEIRAFVKAREWEQYHSEGELARAIMIEAGELNELFLWGWQWQLTHTKKRAQLPDFDAVRVYRREEMIGELADVLIYCLRLADVQGADVADIIRAKMRKNADRYPVAPRNS